MGYWLMCPQEGDCCVQISPRASDNLNWIVHVNSILSVVCGAKNCQILNQLQIQLLITYRHDMTYNATFYQSRCKFFLFYQWFFHTFVYFKRLDKYWFNFLSQILSPKGKFHNLFKHLLLGIKHKILPLFTAGSLSLLIILANVKFLTDLSRYSKHPRPGKRIKRIKWLMRSLLSCVEHHQSSYLCRLMTRPHNYHLWMPLSSLWTVQTNVFVLIVNLHLHFPFIILTSD